MQQSDFAYMSEPAAFPEQSPRPRSPWLSLALLLARVGLLFTTLAVVSALLATAGIGLIRVESNGLAPGPGSSVTVDGISVSPLASLLVVLPLAILSVIALVRIEQGRPLWLVVALAGWVLFSLGCMITTGAGSTLALSSGINLLLAAIGSIPELRGLRRH